MGMCHHAWLDEFWLCLANDRSYERLHDPNSMTLWKEQSYSMGRGQVAAAVWVKGWPGEAEGEGQKCPE